MEVDPKQHLRETNEDDNESRALVRKGDERLHYLADSLEGVIDGLTLEHQHGEQSLDCDTPTDRAPVDSLQIG